MNSSGNSMAIYLDGRRAMQGGDLDKAFTAFRWASCLDPHNPLYSHAAAQAASQAGNQEDAESLYLRAINDVEDVFGPAHQHVSVVAQDLVALYLKQDRHDEARLLSERTAGTIPSPVRSVVH